MTDAMHWGPDVPENPYPKYADARLDPSVKADITFREHDDPESAVAWLDERLAAYEEGRVALARMEPRISDMTPPVSVSEEIRAELAEMLNLYPEYPAPAINGQRELTAEEARLRMAEAERVRERIAALPDGHIVIEFGRPNISMSRMGEEDRHE